MDLHLFEKIGRVSGNHPLDKKFRVQPLLKGAFQLAAPPARSGWGLHFFADPSGGALYWTLVRWTFPFVRDANCFAKFTSAYEKNRLFSLGPRLHCSRPLSDRSQPIIHRKRTP